MESKTKNKLNKVWVVFFVLVLIFGISIAIKIETKYQFYLYLDNFKFALIIACVFIIGVFSSLLIFKKRILLKRVDNHMPFWHSIWLVIRDQHFTLFITTLLLALLIFTFSLFTYGELDIKNDSLSPLFISFAATMLSFLVTSLSLHYAFLAERKANEAQENSKKLIEEKAELLNGFEGFINRIIRKIGDTNQGIISNINQSKKSFENPEEISEKHFYYINCMFLTPFLGHASLTDYDYEAYKRFNIMDGKLRELIISEFCNVDILIPTQDKIVSWYSQILWVEEVKKRENLLTNSKKRNQTLIIEDEIKSKFDFVSYPTTNANNGTKDKLKYSDLSKDEKLQILQIVKNKLNRQKGPKQAVLTMQGNNNHEVMSFSNICDEFKKLYVNKKLRISHNDYIPFQMFLVMKPKNIYHPTLFPDENAFKKNKNSKLELEGEFFVISFVGIDTYKKLIKEIMSPAYNNLRETGISGLDGLLNNLHSAIYSEDKHMCQILFNHFVHYWNKTDDNNHYPHVNDGKWSDLNRIFDYVIN